MKTKPRMIMITVACQLEDGQIIRHDRVIDRYRIESANYTTDVLGYETLQAYKELDKHLDTLVEPAIV